MTDTPARHFTTGDGVRIAFYVDDYTDPWSTAPTLVLTHSAMSSARRMYQFVPHLARRFRVVRMDTRGHGASDIPDPALDLSLPRLVQDVVELLDHLQVDQAHFLGVAAGGYLPQHLAMLHPQRIASAVLVASKPGLKHSAALSWLPQIEEKGLRAFLAETISDRFPAGTPQAQVDWFLDEVARNDVAYVGRFIRHMAGLYWMDEVHRIACPTLVIAPGDEPIGNFDAYEEMQRRMPDCELLVYEGGRHNLGDYVGDRCARDALAFWERRFPVS